MIGRHLIQGVRVEILVVDSGYRNHDKLRPARLYFTRLIDLNYNFECDWLIELSDNKLYFFLKHLSGPES